MKSSKIAAVVFWANAVVHLVSLALDGGLAEGISTWSKFLLMPLLAVWVLTRRGPALIVVALLLSAVGDISLRMSGVGFLVGMGFFGAAHLCYVTFFLRRAARPGGLVFGAYALALAGLIVALWSGLGELRVPVIAYALLLAATGVTSAGFSARTGVGGALFFVSDALIAWGIADRPEPPQSSLWVMGAYIAAQFLLASGTVGPEEHRSSSSLAAGEVTYLDRA